MNVSNWTSSGYQFSAMQEFKVYEMILRGKLKHDRHRENEKKTDDELTAEMREKLERKYKSIIRDYNGFINMADLDDQKIKAARRQYQNALDTVPTDLDDPLFELWRFYLEQSVKDLDYILSDRQPAQSHSEHIRSEIQKTVETMTKLEQDRDEAIKKNPEQADVIRKIYRQAIDRIREQQ